MRWIEDRYSQPRGLRASLAFALLLAPLIAGPQSPSGPPPAPPPSAPPAVVRTAPHFAVVIDAAHGGADSGARLSDHLLEKDLALNLSVRLRSMLGAHGISVVTTRESDAALSALSRGVGANHVRAAACVTLHATTSGS